MTVQPHSVPAGDPFRRLRRLLWGVALLVGIASGLLVEIVRSSPEPATPPLRLSGVSHLPAARWAAGKLPAPDFSLTDQAGSPVSLARFRGRPVLLTFIDPLCRDLCPTEAKILTEAVAGFPAARRPAIVAVSVNKWGNARRVLLQDVGKWKLTADWHWAVGPGSALAPVWQRYRIGVSDAPKTVTGVTVHDISHTEATYLVDANGDQRALWLYPFRAADVARTIRAVAGA
ncbi:MAG TPA: SCO family protein [Gaiellaceae bacterium]|nr:SCO family protein [Gaiellaceae bacterium]